MTDTSITGPRDGARKRSDFTTHPKYRNAAGIVVPSVTTICSRFKDSGGLLYWANKVGREQGLTLDEARKPAATAGTIAHDMVEAHRRGEEIPQPKDVDATILKHANQAFDAYLAWSRQSKLEVLYTEVPLVSEKYQFGGRLDAIGQVEGGPLCLVDWKTSDGLYGDYLLQVAAYRILWEENYPEHPIAGGFHLCRFAKENGDFSHSFFPNLDFEGATFIQLRTLYDALKRIEKRAK